jgi:hypothetical protein
MRGIGYAVVVVAGWLAVCGSARAGVYNPGATKLIPWPQNFHQVRFVLSELRGIALPVPPNVSVDPKDPPLREAYARQAARLEEKSPDEWTPDDRISLSACYIRMRKYDRAVGVLRGGDQGNFLVLLHLASAYHGLDDLGRAREYQQAALAAWPEVWAGWNRLELERARRMERHYLTLLQLREREQRQGQLQWTTTDVLFPGCRFVGPGGKYEAGALALKSVDALPADAFDVVLQLVLWMPFDDRLYWLLGEMLNTRGDVEGALEVFNELISARNLSNVPELVQHRRVLLEAVDGWKEWKRALKEDPGFHQNLFGALQLAALPALGTPAGVGPASAAAGSAAPPIFAEAVARTQGGAPQESSSAAPAAPGSWLPNWTHVTVSFVAGALVAALAGLQWREWQRRQQAAAAAERLTPAAAGEHRPSDGSFRPQG